MGNRSTVGKVGDALVLIAAAAGPSMMVPLSPAHAELADKYVNPVTGQDCVKETGASLKSGSAFVEISFSNSCDRVFSICYAKSDGGPCISELGISANGTMTLIVRAENYPGYWWTK